MFPGPLVRTQGICLHFPAGPKDPPPTDGTPHVAVWFCLALERDPTFHDSPLTSWVVQATFWGALPTADAWLPGSQQSFHMCGNCAGKVRRRDWAQQVGALGIHTRGRRYSRGLKATQQQNMKTVTPSYGNSAICSLYICPGQLQVRRSNVVELPR